ncbi:hypothetical protein HKD37_02G005680 [Glycine soja]
MAEETVTQSITVAAAMGETMSYTRLTSFLQKDTSFLSPWSWDPKASENEASTLRNEKQYLRFQPGSYFAVSIFDLLKERENPRGDDYLQIAWEYEKRMMKIIEARLKQKLDPFY